jgi:hypothetical protein
MKAFSALAAPPDHPFWSVAEEPMVPLPHPITLSDAGWVVSRDADHAVSLVAQVTGPRGFPEMSAAKYRKFAYSSVFGFSGDVPDMVGQVNTDSMLTFTDQERTRRVRLGIEAAGVEAGMVWSTWHPWPDVRVDTVCWAIDGSTHGRVHIVRTERLLEAVETGFAIGYTPGMTDTTTESREQGEDRSIFRSLFGCTALFGIPEVGSCRRGEVRSVAVNANLMSPNTCVPALVGSLEPGTHRLACVVFASATRTPSGETPSVPVAAEALLAQRFLAEFA